MASLLVAKNPGLFKFAVLICRYLIFLKQRSFFLFSTFFYDAPNFFVKIDL